MRRQAMQGVFALAGLAIVITGFTNDQLPLAIIGFALIFLALIGRVFGRRSSAPPES